ncbi:hypothetical protein IMY05_012G0076200 [Salix suchowensis]|nr:hypothetical protein IMY05_012G0076200 [Salix suchowensis]
MITHGCEADFETHNDINLDNSRSLGLNIVGVGSSTSNTGDGTSGKITREMKIRFILVYIAHQRDICFKFVNF